MSWKKKYPWAIKKPNLSKKEKKKEEEWIKEKNHPDTIKEKILGSTIRSAIIYRLKRQPTMQHKLTKMIAKTPRTVAYHLDKLEEWRLVQFAEDQLGREDYRGCARLNEKMPNWVNIVLKKLSEKYDEGKLKKILERGKI